MSGYSATGRGTSVQNSRTYTYAAFGTYTVTFTANGDCVKPAGQSVTTSPDDFSVTAADVTACAASASLTAATSEPATVVWTDLAGTPVDPGAVGAGTYIALATSVAEQCVDQDTAVVTLQDSVDISQAVTVKTACNSTTITFSNTSGYAGVWAFGDGTGTSVQNSGTYTYAAFGTYTVTFTANADCVKPAGQTVTTSPDDFSVTASDVTACAASASLSATTSEPATVVWTDLAGTPVDPGAVGAGTYIALATSVAEQCVDQDTAVVTLQDSVDISQAVTVKTACNSTTITFSNTSGYAGVWAFGDGTGTSVQNSGTYTYAAFGTYTVTFTANADCVKPAGQSVTTSPDDFSVTAADVTACAASASLSATTSEPATVVWTDLSGTPVDPGAVGAGTYIALATSVAEQCVDQDTAVVTLQDSVDISQAVTVKTACNSTTISFSNTSGYAGVWVFGDGTGTSAANNGTYTYAAFGTYTVTFTASADCVKPAGQSVTTSPDDFSVTAADVTACAASASLTAATSEPATVVWTDLAGTPVDPGAVGAGTYIALATSLAAQCVDQDTAVVTLGLVAIVTPEEMLICFGDTVELSVENQDPTQDLIYEWSNGLPAIANPPVSPETLTTYSVTVTNQYGCTDETEVTVDVLLVTVTAEITGKPVLCPNESTTLLATPGGNATTYTYSWSPANTLTGAETATPVATPNGPQVYVVTVTGDDLCTATASVEVLFMETECRDPYIFVPKAFTPNADTNNDFFRVRGTDISEIYFIVYNRWGEEVYKTEDPNHQGWDGTFRGKAATPDSYGWFLRVRCGNGDLFEQKGNVTLLK
ncbi:MAG: gliding motility-associated C-terminal domain-containing protein [Saprospirales bacterium]|nr:gliding motility-associated C-terminal domain-containing protein [Saprospirales bacterium]